MHTGVYIIRNLYGGEEYIGSAILGFRRRWNEHIRFLRKGVHSNWLLQAAWNYFGPNALQFSVLQECAPDDCVAAEQKWMNTLKPEYNICKFAANPARGRKHTDQWKEAARKRTSGSNNPFFGKKHTDDFRRMISKTNLGRVHNAETREKVSAASKRNWGNTEYRKLISKTVKDSWVFRKSNNMQSINNQ